MKKVDRENRFHGLKDIRNLFNENNNHDIYEGIEYLFDESMMYYSFKNNGPEYEEIKKLLSVKPKKKEIIAWVEIIDDKKVEFCEIIEDRKTEHCQSIEGTIKSYELIKEEAIKSHEIIEEEIIEPFELIEDKDYINKLIEDKNDIHQLIEEIIESCELIEE